MPLRVQFHEHLVDLDEKVRLLFAYIPEDIAAATQALLGVERDLLPLLTERERTINDLFKELDALVDEVLALQAPVASDLRFLLSVLRVGPELERSHDLVMHIAEHATPIVIDGLSPKARDLLERMSNIAVEMWHEAARSWEEPHTRVSEELDERDDALDTLHITFMDELSAGNMTLPVSLNMALVARFYERLGDHAVNTSRRAAGIPARLEALGDPPEGGNRSKA
ncbi:MAG: hypothetical protein J2P57_08850 [Acidimicrobiaceae bacterium]|nr:hypothetical protein [Acidimicrobiaceae bacterium]